MTTIRRQDGATDCWRAHNEVASRALDTDSGRLRCEFLSMPALCLTGPQVARLLDLPLASASRLLTDLERDGVLIRTPTGAYRLAEPVLS